jgi:hypothetical protein
VFISFFDSILKLSKPDNSVFSSLAKFSHQHMADGSAEIGCCATGEENFEGPRGELRGCAPVRGMKDTKDHRRRPIEWKRGSGTIHSGWGKV